MLRKLLGAAAMAATAYAFAPAYAAHVHHVHVGVGCSSENLAKAEGGVETMADGPAKFVAEKEIAQAQDAMLSGKISGCAMHLSRAMRSEMAQSAISGDHGPSSVRKSGCTNPGPTHSTNWVPTPMGMGTAARSKIRPGKKWVNNENCGGARLVCGPAA